MKKNWNEPEFVTLNIAETAFGPTNSDHQDAKYMTTINGKKGWEATFGEPNKKS